MPWHPRVLPADPGPEVVIVELMPLLDSRADTILDDAVAAMQRAHLRHYERLGETTMRARLRELYEAMRECVRARRLAPIQALAERIARERHAHGFELGEVQTAFNVLEEALWRRLEAEVEPARLGEALGLVATALGAGKDQLARTYVSLATSTQMPAVDVAALFGGQAGG